MVTEYSYVAYSYLRAQPTLKLPVTVSRSSSHRPEVAQAYVHLLQQWHAQPHLISLSGDCASGTCTGANQAAPYNSSLKRTPTLLSKSIPGPPSPSEWSVRCRISLESQ